MSQAGKALAYAFESGALAPERAFFLRAEPSPFRDCDAEQSFRPEYLRLKRAGWSVVPRLEGNGYPLGQILLTKHKEESFANIARGWALLGEGGTLACAGANDDGAASLERQVGKIFGLAGSLSKFHCRVFWLKRGERRPPQYWSELGRLRPVGDGSWMSQPGIFSWDHIDDGSALLVHHLPGDLSGHVADFGCGWGYLGREIVAGAPGVTALDLIDAEHRAVEAARANIIDSRASFHWLDLATEAAPAIYDVVVCNPPFHAGRAADPSLGKDVIAAAARALRPGGRFFMVANRGLPYDAVLAANFSTVARLADNNKFRVSVAVK
ncbi:MAG: class I SAM-dependent methyltransferase [Reyranella sp.]|uniref:class I SAM-dependent methyltransferase n=1 Tax=Reyranella sp. TaxID=1929291 RepID=UPI003D0F08A2